MPDTPTPGEYYSLIIYETVKGELNTLALGYAIAARQELRIEIPSSTGIFPGTTVSFSVQSYDAQRDLVIPDLETFKVIQSSEDDVKIELNSVKIKVDIIFSTKADPDAPIAWSEQFGNVLVPEEYNITRDQYYITYVKRIRSDLATEHKVLFAICDIPKHITEGLKQTNFLEKLREEEISQANNAKADLLSAQSKQFGQVGFGRTASAGSPSQKDVPLNGFPGVNRLGTFEQSRPNTNIPSASGTSFGGKTSGSSSYPPARADTDEDKQLKELAAESRDFLVVREEHSQGARAGGAFAMVWSKQCGQAHVSHLVIHGTTNPVHIGDWCQGSIKYNRKQKQCGGFSVDKIYEKIDAPYPTKVQEGKLKVAVTIQISKEACVVKDPSNVIVKDTALNNITIPGNIYREYMGQPIKIFAIFQPVGDEFLSYWKFAGLDQTSSYDDALPEDGPEILEERHFNPDFASDDEGDDDELPHFTHQPPPNNGIYRNPQPHIPQPHHQHPPVAPPSWSGSNSGPHISTQNQGNQFYSPAAEPNLNGGMRNHDNMVNDVNVTGIVTEYYNDVAILFATETGACFLPNRNLVSLGAYYTFWARKLTTRECGCEWIVLDGSVNKSTAEMDETWVRSNGHVWVQSNVDFNTFREEPLEIHCDSVGYAACEPEIESEENGQLVIIDDLIQSAMKVKSDGNPVLYLVWLEYVFRNDQYFWIMRSLRGRREDVIARDNKRNANSLRGFIKEEDEIEMEKQKAKAKQADYEEQRRIAESRTSDRPPSSYSGRPRNIERDRPPSVISKRVPSENGYAHSSVSSRGLSSVYEDTVIDMRTVIDLGAKLTDSDLLLLWGIDKDTNQGLYDRLDTVVKGIKSLSDRPVSLKSTSSTTASNSSRSIDHDRPPRPPSSVYSSVSHSGPPPSAMDIERQKADLRKKFGVDEQDRSEPLQQYHPNQRPFEGPPATRTEAGQWTGNGNRGFGSGNGFGNTNISGGYGSANGSGGGIRNMNQSAPERDQNFGTQHRPASSPFQGQQPSWNPQNGSQRFN